MEIFNISHAKTHLSALVARVEAGEEIVIGRADRPLAKLVPYVPAGKPSFLGAARGRMVIPPVEAYDPSQWDMSGLVEVAEMPEDEPKNEELFQEAA